MVAARPDIDKRVEQLVSKGRWSVPGYTASLTHSSESRPSANESNRRNSATFLQCSCLEHSDHFIEPTVYISVLNSFPTPD